VADIVSFAVEGRIVLELRPCKIKENVDIPLYTSLPTGPELGAVDRSYHGPADPLTIASV